ncbi:sulfur transferase domain-containing protein [uncultured Moraxella sp.]|uniref:beta-lactamase hydrolase domain-containing protein n=1 Tax=uncultured Moraxella sp. TaxID=263769 RepID=UPI0025CD8BC6|nr:sulfur transferase domain-containing protein [uncultured Moraxella sp.]
MHSSITLYKQIHPCQCQTLAKLGFKSLVNLRFDDESEYQPTSQSIQDSARMAGLDYHHLPIDGSECVDKAKVASFAKLINELPKPVMVFCNSGSRAKRLYQCALISGLI